MQVEVEVDVHDVWWMRARLGPRSVSDRQHNREATLEWVGHGNSRLPDSWRASRPFSLFPTWALLPWSYVVVDLGRSPPPCPLSAPRKIVVARYCTLLYCPVDG
jgi:hypothetical protein